MKTISLRIALLVAMAALLAVGCGGRTRTEPLRNPYPLQAAPNVAATEAAIGHALAKRGWVVQESRPGVITAMFAARAHKLFVQITYDERMVQIAFAGSQGLEQSHSGIVAVHRKANVWMANLQREIGMALSVSGVAPLPVHGPDPGHDPGHDSPNPGYGPGPVPGPIPNQ